MTPERKRQIREKAEGMQLMRHGGEWLGSAFLECLLEIGTLEAMCVTKDQRIAELEATIADLRKPAVCVPERNQ